MRKFMVRSGLLFTLTSSIFLAQINLVRALSYQFTFNGTQGNAPGTVTGIIDGLNVNQANQIPTDIIVESNPVGIPSGTLLNNYNGGTITVDAVGNITNVINLKMFSFDGTEGVFLNTSGQNVIEKDFGSTQTYNSLGFAGVTYTAIPWHGESALIPIVTVATLLACCCNRRRVQP